MRIGIASDHRGYEKKSELIKLLGQKYNIIDYGNKLYDEYDNYPTFAINLGEAIQKEIDLGIVLCGTGIGVSIAANKVNGVRAAKVDNENEAYYSRLHNNANIIALDSDKDIEELHTLIDKFINTAFSTEERHSRRVKMISDYEEQNAK